MNDAGVLALSPETVLSEMKKNGVTHVVWLPDSETNWLTPLLVSQTKVDKPKFCAAFANSYVGSAKKLYVSVSAMRRQAGPVGLLTREERTCVRS
jgi:hypothetical protein